MRRTWRTVAVALVALAAAAPGAGAGAAPPRASGAVLTTGTRIEWTGVKGFRLALPDDIRLPDYVARLTLRGGSFAAVRMAYPRGCARGHCGYNGGIDYTRDVGAHFYPGRPAGTNHLAHVTDYGRVSAGTWDLYLFTDGVASITFDDTGGLPVRPRAWTAAGRVHGSARRLASTCDTGPCASVGGQQGRMRGGGAYGDTGRYGAAVVFVAHYSRSAVWVPNSHSTRGCAYRAPRDHGKPEDDHPLGCDVVEPDAVWPYNYVVWSGWPQWSGVARGSAIYNATGPVYLGFQLSSPHDLSQPAWESYALWHEYAIR